MGSRTATLVLVVALAGSAGCDGAKGGSDEGAPADVANLQTGDCRDRAAHPFTGDMTGRWVQVQERKASVEMLPESPSDRITRTWFVVDVTQDEGAVGARYTACDVEVDSPGGGTVTTIPLALVHSIPRSDRPAVLSRVDDTWRFVQSDHVELRGVEDLANPLADPLPEDPTDPRIYDQDEDGKFGVTVFVDVAGIRLDVYVAQRIVTALDAEVVADGCFEGAVRWSEDQVILGGVDDAEQSGSILDALLKRPGIEPIDQGSRFRMTRVDEDLAAVEVADVCDAVLADKAKWGW